MPRYLIIAICFAVTIALGVGLVWPKYQAFRDLQLNVEEKREELRLQEEYFSRLKEISEKLKEKEYETGLTKINSALPEDPAIPDLLNFIQQTASENGLILKKIGEIFIKPLKERGIKEVRVNLEFSGSYSAFKNLLASLEESTRLIEVESVSFSYPEKEETFSFSLGIKVHSY